MHPRLRLLLPLLALAAPARAAEPAHPVPAAKLELWTEPLLTTVANTYVLAANTEFDHPVYLPVGVTWRSAPGALAWSVEVTPMLLYGQVGGLEGYSLRVAGGPVLGAGPGESGFFAQPLAALSLGADVQPFGSEPDRGGLGLEVGASAGYRFQWGAFSLTPLLGVGVGLGLGESEGFGPPTLRFSPTGSEEGSHDAPVLLVNVDVDLLRVGWTF